MNYCEFVLRKQLRTNVTYVRKDKQGFRLWKGKLILEEDFQEATKMPLKPRMKENNPCNKHKYLNVNGCAITNLEKLISCEL